MGTQSAETIGRLLREPIHRLKSQGCTLEMYLVSMASPGGHGRPCSLGSVPAQDPVQLRKRKQRVPSVGVLSVLLDLEQAWIWDGRNLILSDRSGRGKTQLATAIAQPAIQNGLDALFATAWPQSSTTSPRLLRRLFPGRPQGLPPSDCPSPR